MKTRGISKIIIRAQVTRADGTVEPERILETIDPAAQPDNTLVKRIREWLTL